MSTVEKITAKAHLLLARLLRLFDITHSSFHYESCINSYFSLTPCSPPHIPSYFLFSSSSITSSTTDSSYRTHPPLPPRSHLLRVARKWAAEVTNEIAQNTPRDDVAPVDDESQDSKRSELTISDQIKIALECVIEVGRYSQDYLFSALACDLCQVCESVGLLENVGIKSEVNWVVRAAEKYAIASVHSHSIDAWIDAFQKAPDESSFLKAISKAIIIDDRVRVQKIIKLIGNTENKQVQCLVEIGRAHADADSVALDAVPHAWRGVLAACEDASDALTCAQFHLS